MSLRAFTLSDLIDRNAALYPERAAFLFDDHTLTHAAYAARIARLAVECWTSWPHGRLMAAIQKRLPAGVAAESCQVQKHERCNGSSYLQLVVEWFEERQA